MLYAALTSLTMSIVVDGDNGNIYASNTSGEGGDSSRLDSMNGTAEDTDPVSPF